jgi:translation initiation factor IF-2
MSESKEPSKKLSLSSPGRLELKRPAETGQVRQSFSHGRSRPVMVEVRKKRTITRDGAPRKETAAPTARVAAVAAPTPAPEAPIGEAREEAASDKTRVVLRSLTQDEKATRVRALEEAKKDADEARRRADDEARRRADDDARLAVEREAADKRAEEEDERKRREEEARLKAEEDADKRLRAAEPEGAAAGEGKVDEAGRRAAGPAEETEAEGARGRPRRRGEPRRPFAGRPMQARRRGGKFNIGQALSQDERVRSLASVRRQREKAHGQQTAPPPAKVVREVVVPESLTVQELASRMAERGVDVIKALMKMDEMVNINQTIDGDTAELIVEGFGHRVKRVSEADVEIGLVGGADEEAALVDRAPVVTVMGHVDHGKTSLLDALRETDVAGGEKGGITQHIGAYQVEAAGGKRICFVDTPGHEAFTAMRARGAKVTDVVVLVVAADDGVMPQTVEAIHHAKAAEVPMVVAINKIDRPDADPDRVRRALLDHEIVVEEMGGEVLSVEVSAKEKQNLDKLVETILLQAEILDLKANPVRAAEGTVIEARMEKGRGSVATVLVQRGTLRMGEVFVAGGEWGRVRAMFDDHGRAVEAAGPSVPVEVLGLNGTPDAGDDLVVVESEGRAREVADFRQRGRREARAVAGARGTLAEMFSKIEAGEAKELPVVIKADVQGSVEAIVGALEKLGTEEVSVRVMHSGAGGINESDVTLADASEALIIGFNVRANVQARELARQQGVDIRYYPVIYDVVDDMKAVLSGMLEPTIKERFLGNAQIREVFSVSKVGKVAGCRVTEGVVRRGPKVRLLRDDVVIHEGGLATLKRFKDEVREVKEGFECGMSLENYQDIQIDDVIEAFELEEVARTL